MKKLLLALLSLGLLAAAALAGTSWWIMQRMGPEVWVEMIEQNTNSRAQIDSATLNIFTRPATLRFQGLRLGPRDSEMDRPIAQRAPMLQDSAPVIIPEVIMEVRLEDLLNRRLLVERLRFIEPFVREAQDAQGRSSLEALFKKPRPADALAPVQLAQSPPPRYNELPPGNPLPLQESPPLLAQPDYPASTLPAVPVQSPERDTVNRPSFSFAMDSATIENGSLLITSPSTQVDVRKLHFTLTGIDVKAHDLDRHNHIHATLNSEITVTGQARIGGVKHPATLAHLILSGEGDVIPINPQTLRWNPRTALKLTLARDSVLAGHITMGDAADKEMQKLLDYGVDLRPVRVGGPLVKDAVVDGVFVDNRFITRIPTLFAFPDYEVVIGPQSWIDTGKDQHHMEFRLSCGTELQQRLQTGIAQAKLGDSLARAVVQALSDERGRMTFDIESSGLLSDPKIEPKIERVFKNLIRGQGLGDLLQGLLNKL